MSRIKKLLSQYGSSSDRFLKITAGEEIQVRLLPPYTMKEKRIAEKKGATLIPKMGLLIYGRHCFLPAATGESEPNKWYTHYQCNMNLGDKCGFCTFFDALGAEDKELKFKYSKRASAFIHVLHRKNKKILIWNPTGKVCNRLEDIFDDRPSINDESKGKDLFISRVGSGMRDTEYTIKMARKPSLLDYDEDLPSILDVLKEDPILSYKEAMKLLKKYFGE